MDHSSINEIQTIILRKLVMPSPTIRRRAGMAAAFAFVLAAGTAARAQTDYFWQAPAGGPGTWNTTTQNWSTVATGPVDYTWANTNNERANFGNTAGTVTLGTGISAFGLNFTTSGYVVTSNTLTLTGTGGVIDSGTGAVGVASIVAGSVGLTKNNTGTLYLSASNTYTGGTIVNSGVIVITAVNSLSNSVAVGTTVLSGAQVQIVDGAAITFLQPITLNGTGIANDGALRNTGDPNLGIANIWSGAITVGTSGAARINSDNGTLTISTGGINGASAGAALTIGGAAATTVSAAIGGNIGTLTKDGAGLLTLSGANAYTGATTINAGALAIGSAGALGATTGVTVAPGGALQLGAFTPATVALTLNGGGSTTSASGTATGGALRGTGAGTWNGAITLASASRINSDSGTLTLTGGINANTAGTVLTVGGGSTVTVTTNPIGANIGQLVKDGPGTLNLTVANAYTGGTLVTGSKLVGTAQATAGTSPFGVATGAMTLNYGSLTLTGIASSTITTVGDLTVGAANTFGTGTSNLIVNNTTGGAAVTTTFAAGNLVRGGGSGVLAITPFTGALGTGTGGEAVTFTGGTATTNGILPAWVVALTSNANTALDFTTYGANGVAVATYSSTDITTSTNASVVNQSTPATLAAGAQAYALKTTAAIDQGGNLLTLGNGSGQSGLILNNGGSITNGNITFGATEGMIYLQGGAAASPTVSTIGSLGNTITSNGLTITAAGAITTTINSNIVDGTSPSRLVFTAITANTTITLNGNNTYSGGTILNVNSGTANIILGTDSAFGTGKVTTILVPGANSPQLQASGGARTLANAFDLNGGLTFTGTNAFTFTGPITLIQGQAGGTRTFNQSVAGTVTFGAASPGASTITLGNPVSNGGDNIGKTLVFNTAVAGATIVLNDTIQDPAPGAGGGVSVTTTGTVTFNGPLTFSGKVSLAGAGTVNMNAGTSASTYAGGTSLTGAGTIITIAASSNALPGASFTAGPFGTGAIVPNNGSNQHLRPVGSQLISNQIITGTGFVMDNAIGDTSNLTFAGPIVMQATGRFISNGFNAALTSLGGTMILGSATAPSTLTLPTVPGQTLTLSPITGPIVVNDVIQQPPGVIGLVRITGNPTENGPAIFTAANTYTGGTSVLHGELVVNNTTGSGTGTGAVTVSAQTTGTFQGNLAGNGTISGAVTVNAGSGFLNGVIAPGPAVATFTSTPNTALVIPVSFGTLTLGSGLTLNGTYTADVQNTPNASDRIAITGNLALGTASILNLPTSNSYDPVANNTIYTLATYTGTVTGTFGSVSNLPAGYVVSYGTVITNAVTLSPVPEPGFVLAVCGGLSGLITWRRRRHAALPAPISRAAVE
jgi:fibronectin-binding autotransporter adhesin